MIVFQSDCYTQLIVWTYLDEIYNANLPILKEGHALQFIAITQDIGGATNKSYYNILLKISKYSSI